MYVCGMWGGGRMGRYGGVRVCVCMLMGGVGGVGVF